MPCSTPRKWLWWWLKNETLLQNREFEFPHCELFDLYITTSQQHLHMEYISLSWHKLPESVFLIYNFRYRELPLTMLKPWLAKKVWWYERYNRKVQTLQLPKKMDKATLIYKILQKKLKMEKHEHHEKAWINSYAPNYSWTIGHLVLTNNQPLTHYLYFC
jgi:hypothetical protein